MNEEDHELWLLWEDLSSKYKRIFNNSFEKFKKTINEYPKKAK